MATGITRLSDVIVPEVFTPYSQQHTEEKTRLISCGIMTRDPFLDNFLAGEGLTVVARSFKDLDPDEENVSTDNGPDSAPNKIGSTQETAVRLSRNNSWGSADLVASLITPDPLNAISDLTGTYWSRRLQRAFIATAKGVYSNNALATDAFHVQNDLTHDISGAAFSAGITSFSAEAFIDATLTMGDAMGDLRGIAVHSIVYGRMQKNNLIEFIPDATGQIQIPTFLGRVVTVDDGVPFTGGVFETWLFGAGAFRLGMGAPKVPVEVERKAAANNGAGQEVLHQRVEWCLHAAGHAYNGAPPAGGPSNAATVNNLASANSWQRVFTERKMVKLARLVTREF